VARPICDQVGTVVADCLVGSRQVSSVTKDPIVLPNNKALCIECPRAHSMIEAVIIGNGKVDDKTGCGGSFVPPGWAVRGFEGSRRNEACLPR